MPLPHYTKISNVGTPGGPTTLPDEVVYLNLFEITFVLPTILTKANYSHLLLLENATKVDFTSLTPEISPVDQRFKYSTRTFLTTPAKTSGELTIPFQVNVASDGSMKVWNTLKAWYDLVWNSQTGYLHYKSDIIGTIIVNQHDKKGAILRRVTFQNCQLKSLVGYSMDWSSNSNIFSESATFTYDYFIDEYIDGNARSITGDEKNVYGI